MALNLSLVIPAYNEADRLPEYLRSVRQYFADFDPDSYEVIVIDDGSRDGTGEMLRKWASDWWQLSVLTHSANRGKGAAVRTGVLAASGNVILFTDADGATPIEEEWKLRRALDSGADLAVGSRYLRETDVTSTRRAPRKLAGRLFSLLVHTLLSVPVRDTQCGIKMFCREPGRRLFQTCQEEGYLFDVWILALASNLGYRTAEVAVHWKDIPGSKLHLVRDSWRMALGILRIRRSIAAFSIGSNASFGVTPAYVNRPTSLTKPRSQGPPPRH